MYLKKLAILGFKSFADKTVLNFDKGITCIVGPNGCGKSNIADAFRWVLGEQSAKSMRGVKMPDVIFAGSTHRKPLNFAEVSLTLSDIQGALPIEYEEITLTRRLHRSGESEYLLNGNVVRLKDLQELFIGSGVGKNAFSIFEQGKLDQVINDTPYERRHIFDEAAGILRFLQRKKDSLKRLEQADQNFSRVNDIYLEVEKQIQTLDLQAQKARIFKEQKILLEQLEKSTFILKWQGLDKKIKELQKKEEKQENLFKEARETVEKFHTHCQELKSTKQEQEKKLRIESEKLLVLRNQQEIQIRQLQTLSERLNEIHLRRKKIALEHEESVLSHQTRTNSIVELNGKLKKLELEWSEAEVKWVNHKDIVLIQEKEVFDLRQQLAIKQQAHLKGMEQMNQLQSDIKQSHLRIENISEHHKNCGFRYQQLKHDLEQLLQYGKERKKNLQQLSALVDSHRDRLDQFEEEIKAIVLDLDMKQKESELIRRKVMELRARQKVLLRMRDDLEGFSSGSKKLLMESKNPESTFFQLLRPLYEFFTSHNDVTKSIAIILRNYAQTLVVESIVDFWRIISFAKELNLQDYSLICVEGIKIVQSNLPPNNSIEHPFLNKVSSNILSNHFLNRITIRSSDEEIVSSWLLAKMHEGSSDEGTFIDSYGVFFKVKLNENQVFVRESELLHLEKEIVEQEGQMIELEENLELLQKRKNQLQMERTELDKLLRRDEMKLVEVNFGYQRNLNDQEKNQSDQKNCEVELTALTQQLEQQKKIFCDYENQFTDIRNEFETIQNENELLKLELEKRELALRTHQKDLKDNGELYQQLAEHRQQIVYQIKLLESKEQEYEKTILRIEEEVAEMNDRQNQIQHEEKEVQKRLLTFQEQVHVDSDVYKELEKHVEALFLECEKSESLLTESQDKFKSIEIEFSQIRLQQSHQLTALESVKTELFERYQLTIEEALQINPTIDRSLEQTERQIKQVRHSIQECGDVNLTAIEELEKNQNRFHFLKDQMNDMQSSKDELLAIIKQLDKESHKLFEETFEKIRTNFQKNFKILFNGGEADLQLTEAETILEAGIEISAKPPGKQMRSITLLSGGEKCLTAVALLFSIFEVRPAPFCILDEIDAPLDDTNVERFVNVVKHFVDKCQFLIITHNKRTMAIGDILFGISMEEKGVSKLLSLEFAKNELPEALMIS